VYAFGYTYVLGQSPDLLPGVVMQRGNKNPVTKIRLKKSWEIEHNLCGSTPAREPKSMWNDDQPLLPVHLIDGDPETAWSSRGGQSPDRQPEWIRIDLAAESTISSVALVCSEKGPGMRAGKILPGDLTVKLSCDGENWTTVYENNEFSGPDTGPTAIEFTPQRAKQIWIITQKMANTSGDGEHEGDWGHCFSIGEVEVRDPDGNNLALISRGAGVQVSSTYYGYGMDRFTQSMLWPIQYDLGFKWLRVGYDMGLYLWNYVEREKGKLEIDPVADAAITDAVRCGMKVIMCLDKGNWLYHDPPRKVDWKRARYAEMMETYYDHQGWPTDSPELMEGYLRYVDYMVRHFKGRVEYFEPLNEWEGIGIENFLRTTRAAIPVIKAADPEARIMLGSTSGFSHEGGGRDLILRIFRENPDLVSQIDAVGFHPWYQVQPDDPLFRRYRADFTQFRRDCEALGFRGAYGATEWTWAAPYPGDRGEFTEMTKAKYSAQLMTAHCGMDIISLYNETFQSGKIDWDCNLLRNAFSVDPISATQPQPVYYVLRNISTVLDGFHAADIPVKLDCDRELECYTFHRADGEILIATWIPGKTTDGIAETPCDVTVPGVRAKAGRVIDILNGTEQQLDLTADGTGTRIPGVLVKDYPTFIRIRPE
jgi:hypothetical protein